MGSALLEVPWVIGPGRLGLALARELTSAEAVRELWVGRRGKGPPPGSTSDKVRHFRTEGGPPNSRPTLILLTVPDAAITEVAEQLAGWALPPVPVLHTSGATSSRALSALERIGHPTGSLHPLVAVRRDAVDGWLSGSWFGIEGRPRALEAAQAVVQTLGGRSFVVDDTARAAYHAASVFASNYVVVLLEVAERLMKTAGVPPEVSRDALACLALSAVENTAATDPVRALTGPVTRGDLETVRRHLGGLSPSDRKLYSVLASEALALARRQGLDPVAADELAQILENP